MTQLARSAEEIRTRASQMMPGILADLERHALARHLETYAPWGAQVTVEKIDWDLGPPFRCPTDGPGYGAARRALGAAFGRPPGEAGSGGSVPLLQTIQQLAPEAEFVLWGPQDMARSRIHASDESVDPAEIERMIVAQACFLEELASLSRNGGS